jgi:uncharacterized membrane protein YcaP (DUF421 family)
MPSWLIGQGPGLAVVAAKAALIYLVAVLGLRIAQRRTLSQWTAIDFAATVAIGAILGRTAVAGTQSFVVGAVALVTILAAHAVVNVARHNDVLAKAVDHRVRVLVENGSLRMRQLRICGITENDLLSKLRQQGVREMENVRYVLYETKGELTIVEANGENEPDSELVERGLRDAAGYP